MEARQLLIIFQVAITFAGFAGLIAAYEYRDKASRGDVIGIAMIVNVSLTVAFSAIIPVILSNFGLSQSMMWAVGSGLSMFFYAYVSFLVYRSLSRIRIKNRLFKAISYILYLVNAFMFSISLMNILKFEFHREYGPFFLCLVYPLLVVGYMFSRMLMRPLWKVAKRNKPRDPN